MGSSTGDLVTRVQSAHLFDHDALFRYAADNVSGFPTNPSQFTISQVTLGSLRPPQRSKLYLILLFPPPLAVRTRAIESDVSDRCRLGELHETLRFEEEASWEALAICSRC